MEGIIEVTYKDKGQEAQSTYQLIDGSFRTRDYHFLKKAAPPVPADHYLKLYAGTYQMIPDGKIAIPESDRYVFSPDGKVTWTITSTKNPDGSVSKAPIVNQGTWKASEGLIQMYFEGFGELLTDYKLDNGVFRAEQVFLKKVVSKAPLKK
jgi:hypothetical protein